MPHEDDRLGASFVMQRPRLPAAREPRRLELLVHLAPGPEGPETRLNAGSRQHLHVQAPGEAQNEHRPYFGTSNVNSEGIAFKSSGFGTSLDMRTGMDIVSHISRVRLSCAIFRQASPLKSRASHHGTGLRHEVKRAHRSRSSRRGSRSHGACTRGGTLHPTSRADVIAQRSGVLASMPHHSPRDMRIMSISDCAI